MTSWEKKYKKEYKKFVENIIDWQPDFIVPTARKSCKLFETVSYLFTEVEDHIFYREYFEFTDIDLSGVKVALVDDAVYRTSTLKAHRDFFEAKGVLKENIRTYGFVGHMQLLDNPSKKCDKDAFIFAYLAPVDYEEYLMLQSNHFILNGVHQDIDHLVIEAEVGNISCDIVKEIWNFLEQWGYRYRLAPIKGIDRFGIHSPSFFSASNTMSALKLPAESDFVEKIRFTFLENKKKLMFIPMVFPKMFSSDGTLCVLGKSNDYFNLPCSDRKPHKMDEVCYKSLCFLLSSLFAREFLATMKKNSPQLAACFKKVKVKEENLVRFMGKDKGIETLRKIQLFLKGDTTFLEDVIRDRKNNVAAPVSMMNFSFSLENIPKIICHLREGYEAAVRKNNNNPEGVKKYVKPVDFLLNLGSGTHPLVFTEVIDDLCDFGVLVPKTEFVKEDKCWRRVYRTGEGNLDKSGERTRYIISLAIKTLNSDAIVPVMHFEKTFANFVCDFPRASDNEMMGYPEYHCLSLRHSYWGDQNYIFHPLVYATAVPLVPGKKMLNKQRLAWEEFAGGFFGYNENTRTLFSNVSLKKIGEFCDKRFLRDYFRFLSKLKNAFNNVDVLNALALCRSRKRFYNQIKYNLSQWLYSERHGGYVAFLESFRNGGVKKDLLDFSARMFNSAAQKLKFPLNFSDIVKECDKIAKSDEISFEDVWHDWIKKHIVKKEAFSLLSFPEIETTSKITGAVGTLDGLTRLKLDIVSPEKKNRTLKRVLEEGPQELVALGIDFDIESFLKVKHSRSEVYNKLYAVYNKIACEIERLPDFKKNKGEEGGHLAYDCDDVSEIWEGIDMRRTREYLRIDKEHTLNKLKPVIIKYCKDAGLESPRPYTFEEREDGIIMASYIGDYKNKILFKIVDDKIIKVGPI